MGFSEFLLLVALLAALIFIALDRPPFVFPIGVPSLGFQGQLSGYFVW